MKKFAAATFLFLLSPSFAESDLQPLKEQRSANADANKSGSEFMDEFSDLSEPHRNVSGAYYGLGLASSIVAHKVTYGKGGALMSSLKKSAHQFDVSLIFGFGAPFYDRYYAGIELDLFKRFPKKTSYNDEIGVIHSSNIGLNMDVRFGYLFPEHGSMIYITAGFARVVGKVTFDKGATEGSFGSFYPTFGVGLEHKINHRWNVRGDFRIALASKDDNKYSHGWKYEAKPGRIAFRVSITRNI
ncbi:MAG: porin family protein [Holosporaceae bacterium]|jgi:hypothetical protein|nr:porin family protein [Holosporaceae bacterium]